ncbi:hypothetical protein [Mangrovihabitans endophyticus]|uniref:hypothetical protein n=1 Tax=Mangrovihabitans endophyticus TaxID=1751298 RepID=UPI00166B7686|nr:hypothetical protein [Mangrovihabitans endophyticus]
MDCRWGQKRAAPTVQVTTAVYPHGFPPTGAGNARYLYRLKHADTVRDAQDTSSSVTVTDTSMSFLAAYPVTDTVVNTRLDGNAVVTASVRRAPTCVGRTAGFRARQSRRAEHPTCVGRTT